MQVLLTQDVAGVGKAGEVKKVSDGYARNFILPRKLGVVATPQALRQVEHVQQAQLKHRANVLSQAQALSARLDQIELSFRAKAGESDRLFGSITSADIADALEREHKITVDKRKIELPEPIKSLGPHRVAVRISPDATGHIRVKVERE